MKKILLLLLLISPAVLFAANFTLSVQGGAEWAFTPHIDNLDGPPFDTGAKGELQLDYSLPPLPFLSVYVNGGYGFLPTKDDGSHDVPDMHRMEYVLGLSYTYRLTEKFGLKAYGDAGYYYGWWDDSTGGDFMASAGLAVSYGINEHFDVYLSPRYRFYAHNDPGSIHSLDALLGFSWNMPW